MFILLFLSLCLSDENEENSCDPNEFFEEGFICCNYSICDKYCYKDTCIKSQKVWFCFQEGVGYFFSIKILPSFIFFIFRFIINFLFHEELLNLFYIFCSDFVVNIFLFISINGFYCYEVWLWVIFAIIVCSCLIFAYFFILYKNVKNYNRDFKHLKTMNKFYYHLKYSLFRTWIYIFTLSGYYTIFDTFAYLLNKFYKSTWLLMYFLYFEG